MRSAGLVPLAAGVAAWLLGGAALVAQQPDAARSPRNASYSIDVELDPASRTLTLSAGS